LRAAIRRASTLSPIALIASGLGPIKVSFSSQQLAANALFSERNP
jgi:hypothetical protein